MFGDINWATDVMPVVQQFTSQSIVRGGLIAIVAISVGVLGARGLISVFFKRE